METSRSECNLRVIEQRCEYQVNPIGVETRVPRLSWVLESDIRGEKQIAYQILISSSLQLTNEERGDIFNSGKVVSSESFNIEIHPTRISTAQRYWWRVRVWDSNDAPSDYSSPSYWENGIMNLKDWIAKWIGGGKILHGIFEAKTKVISARLFIAGLGYYEVRINSQRIEDRELTPAWTDYEKRILYDTYDVSDQIVEGENTIRIDLGKGRYPPAAESDPTIAGYGPSKAIAQLLLMYGDGTTQTFGTDESWKAADGPLLSDDVYKGETYDSRLGDVVVGSRQCEVEEAPRGKLVSSATFPPIRVPGSLQPKTITFVSPGVYTYDFGQNFSGWVKLKVSGPRGTKVTLRYAEILSQDGKTINTRTNEKAESKDTYILNGEGVEEYQPRFTYHGFRYVEVSGFPGVPTLESLEGRIVHTDVASTGGFICSDPLINEVHWAVRRTQLCNLMSVPTDCPQRNERMGWLGDAVMSSEEAIFNFWMPTFYEKWLVDIRDTQSEDGSINAIAPACWIRKPAEPSWGLAYFLIPYELYLYYGDLRVIQEHFSSMRKYFLFLVSMSRADGMLELNRDGDYSAPYRIRSFDTPGELISTWVLYLSATLMSRISNVLGINEKESEIFASVANKSRDALNTLFLKKRWDRTKDLFLESYGDTQTSNVLPLSVNIVPENKLNDVLASLVVNIVKHHDNHLDSGEIGTKYLFQVLSTFGYEDIAYAIARQTTYPSYGYMLREGATTLWERWEYVTSEVLSSHNHILFGSIDAWFYKYLGGIQTDESRPGFRHIIINPRPPAGLESVCASINTVRGLLRSDWISKDDVFSLKVKIPTNSDATIHIPKPKANGRGKIVVKEGTSLEIFRDGAAVEHLPEGIESVRETADSIVCEVGSGEYVFLLTNSNAHN